MKGRVQKTEADMQAADTVITGDYGAAETAMQEYLREDEKRAYALDNRGPIRFSRRWSGPHRHPGGLLEIWLLCLRRGAQKEEELNDIEADLFDILERLPTERGAAVDDRVVRPWRLSVRHRRCSGPDRSAIPLAEPTSPTVGIRSRCWSPPRLLVCPRKWSIS